MPGVSQKLSQIYPTFITKLLLHYNPIEMPLDSPILCFIQGHFSIGVEKTPESRASVSGPFCLWHLIKWEIDIKKSISLRIKGGE